MKPLLQAMKERRLYLDGGMGSMLQAAGLPEGLLPDVWGMQNPAAVQGVHRAYLEAGARLITTNTFGTSIVIVSRCFTSRRWPSASCI